MDKYQEVRWLANLRIGDLETLKAAILATIADYAPFRLEGDALRVKIKDALDQQGTDVKAATPTKASTKIAMGTVVHKFASASAVKAHLLNKTVLETGLKEPITYILVARDTDAAERAIAMWKLMKDNLPDLDNLIEDNIDEMEAAIKAFEDIKVVPSEMVKTKKAYGTDPIPGYLDELDVCNKYKGMLIHSNLPDLGPVWDVFSKVGEPKGTRHLSLVALLLDSETDAPLKRIKVRVTNMSIVHAKDSTKKGTARFLGLDSGNWELTAEHKNYLTEKRSNIRIVEGEVTKLVIKLKQVAGAGMFGMAYGRVFNKVTLQSIPYALVFLQGLETPVVANGTGNWDKTKVSKDCTWIRVTAPGYDAYESTIEIITDVDTMFDIGLDAVAPEPPTPTE